MSLMYGIELISLLRSITGSWPNNQQIEKPFKQNFTDTYCNSLSGLRSALRTIKPHLNLDFRLTPHESKATYKLLRPSLDRLFNAYSDFVSQTMLVSTSYSGKAVTASRFMEIGAHSRVYPLHLKQDNIDGRVLRTTLSCSFFKHREAGLYTSAKQLSSKAFLRCCSMLRLPLPRFGATVCLGPSRR